MNFLPGMSNYARRMTRLSAKIFGEVARPTNSKSMKVVKLFSERPVDLDPYIVEHYPPHIEYSTLIRILREHGLFRDEHLDFKEEMIRQRALRGKVKPQRGQGKQALSKQHIAEKKVSEDTARDVPPNIVGWGNLITISALWSIAVSSFSGKMKCDLI